MDQDRGSILVLSHHESEVQEALRLIQADADFPATLGWLTTMLLEVSSDTLHSPVCFMREARCQVLLAARLFSIGRVSFVPPRMPLGLGDGLAMIFQFCPPHARDGDSTIVLRVRGYKHVVTSWNTCCQRPGQFVR